MRSEREGWKPRNSARFGGRGAALVSSLALASAASDAGCGSADPCDVAALEAQLVAAHAGDVIVVPACTFEASLVVPAGVTLRGQAGARIVGPSDAPAVSLATVDGATTTLESLAVEGHHVAVASEGSGTVAIASLSATCEEGVCVALDASGGGTVVDSSLTGTVTAENRDASSWLASTASTAPTHGVVATRGAIAITSTTIRGFAWAAVSLDEASEDTLTATLTDTDLGAGLGSGLVVDATSVALTRTTIHDVWTGVRGWPSYALFVDRGTVTSDELGITDVDGFGVVQTHGDATHTRLHVASTGDVGLWVGAGVTASVVGPNASFEDTAFSAVVAVDAARLTLDQVTIDAVRAVRRTVLVLGAIEVGDGVEVVGTPFELSRVSIRGAERLGLLVDHAALATSTLDAITVDASGTALGAVLGDVDRASETASHVDADGWDASIVRLGSAATNDAAFTGSLAAIVASEPPSAASARGVVAPMY